MNCSALVVCNLHTNQQVERHIYCFLIFWQQFLVSYGQKQASSMFPFLFSNVQDGCTSPLLSPMYKDVCMLKESPNLISWIRICIHYSIFSLWNTPSVVSFRRCTCIIVITLNDHGPGYKVKQVLRATFHLLNFLRNVGSE